MGVVGDMREGVMGEGEEEELKEKEEEGLGEVSLCSFFSQAMHICSVMQ